MSRDGFLERWSRRKLSEGKEPEAKLEQPDEQQAAAVADEAEDETLDEAELAKLPSLDAFTVKTDLAPFLRKGVPQALKNAAMRKMWMLDPAVRDHVDFAVDYAWDWNTPGGVAGNAGTISQDSIARMMDSLNPKPKETASEEPTDGETVASTAEEQPHEPEAQAQAQAQAAQAVEDKDLPAPQAGPEADPAPRPRRHGGAAPV